ncbi:MAG: NAD(P)H-dependent oxidoreductase [Planctomycetaceae bacterium]|nr:NAD(P)H-dependent oxidoreductase [Planctomycetaceae bacterium]
MKRFVIAAAVLIGLACGLAYSGETVGSKNLIVIFSKTGNTMALAEQIQAQVGGDMFQVRTAKPYPEEYRATTEVARAELDNNERPELAEYLDSLDGYDVIYFGFPIWWGTMPMAMLTFLERYDFTGKTIAPFTTHGGGGASRSYADLQRAVPTATILPHLVVSGSSSRSAGGQVTEWLRQNNLLK